MATAKKKTQTDVSQKRHVSGTATKQSEAAKADKICHVQQYFHEHPFLASLIPKNGILFECDGDAPSPSKDYGQLQVGLDKVIILIECLINFKIAF